MSFPKMILGVALCAGLCAAQVANLSGIWKLNVGKSSWGKKQKPSSVIIQIEHREPVLAYSGTVLDTLGDGREFDLKGVLDGKEYPIQHSNYGPGKITLRRVDLYTTAAVFKSNDGLIVEETKTTISRNGKFLTHAVALKDPAGEMRWTELYEKQ